MPGAISNPTNASMPFTSTDPSAPGSPWWWLSRLGQRLMDRQKVFATREDYADGRHPLPHADERYKDVLRSVMQKSKTNYIELVIRATTQKMRVKGFRWGSADVQLSEDAARIWSANEMAVQSAKMIRSGAVYGFMYALVSPPETEGGIPVITAEDPRMCEVEPDPVRPFRSRAGLKVWLDTAEGAVYAVLYLPDVVIHFKADNGGTSDLLDSSSMNRVFAVESVGKFEVIKTTPNPLSDGTVALVRGEWEPGFSEHGRSEAECGFDIQDRINKTILDRLVIANNQAFRQRWITGVEPPAKKAAGGPEKPPFNPGSDKVWAVPSKEARFGDFQEADIRQVLEAARDDVGDLAAITQTPSTYLTNKMVNVSGDTLAQAQAGHLSKVRQRCDAAGNFFERQLRIAFMYMNDAAKAQEVFAETVWEPLESSGLGETGDFITKAVSAGIPLQLAMDRVGAFSPAEIRWAVEEAERQKQIALAREDELLSRQSALEADRQESNETPTSNSQEE